MHYKLIIVLAIILFVNCDQNTDEGHCEVGAISCDTLHVDKYLFYDINPPEGFNLRRDVYMRLALMLVEAQKVGKLRNWKLVLPPWYRLYHWQKSTSNSQPFLWSKFFDVDALKSYAPVLELYEVFAKETTSKVLEIDVLYVLQPYYKEFNESNSFEDLWEITDESCEYDGQFWGWKNVTAKEILCIKFQGKVSTLVEILALHPRDTKIMFHHTEIPIYDTYGNKQFWDCRKSMKFSKHLIKAARNFMEEKLFCDNNEVYCKRYIAVHWRRRDFKWSHRNQIPSTSGTAKQINEYLKIHSPTIQHIYIATDADNSEKQALKKHLEGLNNKAVFYEPDGIYTEGEEAIIEQIICSHARHFIGTSESTFTFRIQQEREILKFPSDSTFNQLCPDNGCSDEPAKWTIVD